MSPGVAESATEQQEGWGGVTGHSHSHNSSEKRWAGGGTVMGQRWGSGGAAAPPRGRMQLLPPARGCCAVSSYRDACRRFSLRQWDGGTKLDNIQTCKQRVAFFVCLFQFSFFFFFSSRFFLLKAPTLPRVWALSVYYFITAKYSSFFLAKPNAQFGVSAVMAWLAWQNSF